MVVLVMDALNRGFYFFCTYLFFLLFFFFFFFFFFFRHRSVHIHGMYTISMNTSHLRWFFWEDSVSVALGLFLTRPDTSKSPYLRATHRLVKMC